jgi:hypothetical protein
MPNRVRCFQTACLGRRSLRLTSWSFILPSSRISRAVQRRGPVGKPMPRAQRSASTSLSVRPCRSAKTESGVLPSFLSSAAVQGAPERYPHGCAERAVICLKFQGMTPWQGLRTGVCGRLIAADRADGSRALTVESVPGTDFRRKEELRSWGQGPGGVGTAYLHFLASPLGSGVSVAAGTTEHQQFGRGGGIFPPGVSATRQDWRGSRKTRCRGARPRADQKRPLLWRNWRPRGRVLRRQRPTESVRGIESPGDGMGTRRAAESACAGGGCAPDFRGRSIPSTWRRIECWWRG